jgi:hypothetical protein
MLDTMSLAPILSGFLFCISISLLRRLFGTLTFLPNYWSELYIDGMFNAFKIQFLVGIVHLVPYLIELILTILWVVFQNYLFISFFNENLSIAKLIFCIDASFALLYFLNLLNSFTWFSKKKSELSILSNNYIVNLFWDDLKLFLSQLVFFTSGCLIGYLMNQYISKFIY